LKSFDMFTMKLLKSDINFIQPISQEILFELPNYGEYTRARKTMFLKYGVTGYFAQSVSK